MWCRNAESVAAECNGCFSSIHAAASNEINHDHLGHTLMSIYFQPRWRESSSQLFLVFQAENAGWSVKLLYVEPGVRLLYSGFGGLVVSMLASGTQDRGFEAVGFFSGVKNPKHAFLRKGNKAVGPVS
jgi:hypothetical protein